MTLTWPGAIPQGTQQDRCYEFVRACGGYRAKGPQLEALAVVWEFMRRIGLTPSALTRAGQDAVLNGVSLTSVLSCALPGIPESPRTALALRIADTCASLATSTSASAHVITGLQELWLRIYAAMEDCAALTDDDYPLLGRVAATLNPSMGGLAACYCPADDVEGADRDRVDVLVANIAMIAYAMLRSDPVVRAIVMRYFMGNSLAGATDPARAEVARYADVLESALEQPSYTHADHISRSTYDRGMRRVLGTDTPNLTLSADIATWKSVVGDTLARLPCDFTGDQAATSVQIILAIRCAVQDAQPTPVWGNDANWGIGILFAIAMSGAGPAVEKVNALAAIYAYYVSIEKARDAVKGAWEGLDTLPEPALHIWEILTAGWPQPVKQELWKAHARTRRLRGSTACRDKTPAPAHLLTDDTDVRLGPTYQEYVWDRAHDGFWPFAEVFAVGELGGPLHPLEEESFWLDTEAGMCAFEAYHGHRRRFEDEGRGMSSHLIGPATGRTTWLFTRALQLWKAQIRFDETDTTRVRSLIRDGTFWYWSLSFPGTPTWRNLTATAEPAENTTFLPVTPSA